MLQKTIMLGGREFVLAELPRLQNADWRVELESKLEPLINLISGVNKLELNTAADIDWLVQSLRGVLLKAPDVLVDLVLSYSPELREQEEWINLHVYESELIPAIQEVIAMAYPLGSVVGLARQINGLAQTISPPISKN